MNRKINSPMGEKTVTVNSRASLPSLTIDWELYEAMLIESDAPDEQKRELIQTLHNICVAFVDLGFGVHPLQQACDNNELLEKISVLDWAEPEKDKFSKTSSGDFAAATKEPDKAGSKG